MAKPMRLDPRGLSAILHAAQQPTALSVVSPPASTQDDPELLLGAGDAAGRLSFFDATTSSGQGSIRVIAQRARLPDYIDQAGKRTHRKAFTLPPSTVARIARAVGGRPDETDGLGLNAVVIGLAEWALGRLEADGLTLTLRGADDPRKAERLAARRRAMGRRS